MENATVTAKRSLIPHLNGAPLDEDRALAIFKRVAPNERIVDWREKAQRSRDSGLIEQAANFDRYAEEQEEGIRTTVGQWLILVKTVLPEIADGTLRIETEV